MELAILIIVSIILLILMLILAVFVGSVLRESSKWTEETAEFDAWHEGDDEAFQTIFDRMTNEYGWDKEDSPFAEIQELLDTIDPDDPLGTKRASTGYENTIPNVGAEMRRSDDPVTNMSELDSSMNDPAWKGIEDDPAPTLDDTTERNTTP